MDGGFEILDRPEDAALEALFGEPCEEPLDGIEPGCRDGREMEDEARMAGEPGKDVGMLVGGIVVDDDMDGLCLGHLGFDGGEEADELLMTVTLHALADDLAF